MILNFKNIAGCLLAKSLIALGFVKRAKKKALRGEYIISLYFHAPGKKLFEEIIEWLRRNGFHFISMKSLRLIAKGEMSFPRGAVFLTFDDGRLTNAENVIPLAKQYDIPITIFVTTEAIENGAYWWSYTNKARKKGLIKASRHQLKLMADMERVKLVDSLKALISVNREAMSVDQLKKFALDNNLTIGGHTVTHPILPNCDDHESTIQIAQSKATLENWLNIEVDSFAFPNGDYSQREVQQLQDLGFCFAFTTKEEFLTPERLKNPYELPRFYVNESASLSENICRMMGVWPTQKPISTAR